MKSKHTYHCNLSFGGHEIPSVARAPVKRPLRLLLLLGTLLLTVTVTLMEDDGVHLVFHHGDVLLFSPVTLPSSESGVRNDF
ncbi:hypothetical protein AAC387_Pa02g1727 [Persea americana]